MTPSPPAKVRPPLPEGPFLIVGLARSGVAAARFLAQRGETVVGTDSGDPDLSEAGLETLGVEVHLDTDGLALLEGTRCVVKSPGVPREAPVIATARERGIEVMGELELAWRALPNRFIAVTGTNGKTTTVEMLGHVYRSCGAPVAVAGNVGTPLASLPGKIDDDATVICEASSFQLEDTELFAPECAVFLNLAADHLDRHGSIDDYLDAKLRIFRNQANEDVAVHNGDVPVLEARDLGGCGRRMRFCPAPASSADPDCEVSVANGVIFAAGEPLLRTSQLKVLGDHNVANAMAAAAAALAMGLGRDAVADGLRSFPGVPHRLERVAEIGGVAYVNDSKATNVGAATVGIRSIEGPVHVILGGSLKGEDFSPLAAPVAECCRSAHLIGEAAAQLEDALAPAAGAGTDVSRRADLADAVSAAAAAAEPGDTVLLSPACASFDSFGGFEERGDAFRTLVGELS